MTQLSLTRLDLLEACNDISVRYGGRNVGTVEGYRNQWLVSVELRDMARLNATMAILGLENEAEEHVWIRCGFCQSTISKAPDGGWTLEIPYEVLCRCRTTSHVVRYFEAWLGRAPERERKRREWEAMVDAVAVEQPGLALSFRVLKELQEAMHHAESIETVAS